LAISAITLWEVAKAVQVGHLSLPEDVERWIEEAIAYPGIAVVPLDARIVTESTRLPGQFHRDPADQMIVATARVLDATLLTVDKQILAYEHVKLATPDRERDRTCKRHKPKGGH
jgi:PIN domain nuclease of toxin-antitoxin system